ncbi:MAG: YtxH domain-containing protein [Bacilli bacterium]|nr:YtxH domain-containing protein [Bacilli bacterium]
MKKKSNFGKFVLGAAVGATLGVLFAPKSGKETRKELAKKFDELIEKVKEIDVKEVREEIEKKANEIIKELKELDKEKVLKIAKQKSKELKEKANELVEYAKEKATPVVEEAAENLRLKAIDATKKVLAKLESKKSA